MTPTDDVPTRMTATDAEASPSETVDDASSASDPSAVTQTSVTVEIPDYWKTTNSRAETSLAQAPRRGSSRATTGAVTEKKPWRKRLIVANTSIGFVVVALSGFIFLSDPAVPVTPQHGASLKPALEAPQAGDDFTGGKSTECLQGGSTASAIPDEVAEYRITGTPLSCGFARDVIDRLLAHVAVKPGESHFALKDLFSEATGSNYSGSCVRRHHLTRCQGPAKRGTWGLEVKDQVGT